MNQPEDASSQSHDLPIPVSPEATGGAGTLFEQHVGAFFLGLLLVKGIPPCCLDGRISEVHFQTRNDGWHTDDILVKITAGDGLNHSLALQVKLGFTVSAAKSNSECREVISGAWKDFQNSQLFNRETDLLGVAVARGTQVLLKDFCSLLSCAGTCRTAVDFFQRLSAEGFLSKQSHDQYDAIHKIICESEEDHVPDREIWLFLRSLRLLYYDFDRSTNQSAAQIMNLLEFVGTRVDPKADAKATWHEILEIAGKGMPESEKYSYDTLPQDLRERYRVIGATERGPIRQLREHSAPVLGRISTVIKDDIHINRDDLVQGVVEKLELSNVLVVSGPAGIGKSAIAREACDILADKAYVFAMRSEEFAKPHLDTTLNSAQIPFQAQTLFDLLAAHDRKILLVESVERLLEKSERHAFADLLLLVNRDPSWRLLLTCRSYSLDLFRSAFLDQWNAQHEVIETPSLDDAGLDTVAETLPALRRPLSNDRLRELLRTPYVLDIAAKMTWPGSSTLPVDEREFRKRVWCEVVRGETETHEDLPRRRAKAFQEIAVQRAKSLAAFVQSEGIDREALRSLQRDNLIEFYDDSELLAAPAHDVLEDWALQQWIEERYAFHQEEYDSFLEELDTCPAIRRAYRQWLNGIIESQPEVAKKFIAAVAFHRDITSQIRDDTLVSVMLSEESAKLLLEIREFIVQDNCRLLIRLIHLLRVACKAPPRYLSGKQISRLGVFLVPKGSAWAVVLEFVAENLDDLIPAHSKLLLGLVKDWSGSVSLAAPYPPGSGHAANISGRLLPFYERGGYELEDQAEDVLETILKIPRACEQTFKGLIDRACSASNDDGLARTFAEMILKEMNCTFACRDFPDDVIRLAKARWIRKPAKDTRRHERYHDIGRSRTFGLSDRCEHDYFPSSAWRGPFLQQLRFHNEKSLAFIIDLVNHAIYSYVHERGEGTDQADDVCLVLNDGRQVKQWYDSMFWHFYRGSTDAPNLLQSALMALEAWLIEQCEKDEDICPILDIILIKSNNVALSAVVASVALAYPNEVGASAFPLLRCREFIQVDLQRMLYDQQQLSSMLFGLPTLPKNELYQNERKTSNSLPHRKLDLEGLAVQLQTGHFKEEMKEIIDEHYSVLPPREEQSEADKLWRIALQRMDVRGWEVKEQLDDGRVAVGPASLEEDLQQIVDTTTQDQIPLQKAARLSSWGMSVFNREEGAQTKTGEWREYLSEAIDSPANTQATDDPTVQRIHDGGISYIAAVCIRDHWDDLTDSQRKFCIDTVINSISENADTDDHTTVVSRSITDAAKPAAMILPLVYSKSLDVDTRNRVENALLLSLTHACHEVVECAGIGVGTYLWGENAELAGRCAALCVQRAEIFRELSERNYAQPYEERVDGLQVIHNANLQLRQIAHTIEPVDERQFVSLNIEVSEHWREFRLLLRLLGNPASGQLGRAFMKHVAEQLVKTWQAQEENRSRDYQHLNYELEIDSVRCLARLCVQISHHDALEICRTILNATQSLPDKVADFIKETILGANSGQDDEVFWHIWHETKVRALPADWVNHLASRYPRGGELIRILFLNLCWNDGVRHWRPLEGNWQRIDELFMALPACRIVTEAYLYYLFYVGRRGLLNAIRCIHEKLYENTDPSILYNSNTSFYLESLLGGIIYTRPAILKNEKQLRESVLWILDSMVDLGSSAAYLMRDDFVTPISPQS